MRIFGLFLALTLLVSPVAASPVFPVLSGHVVDDAHVLPQEDAAQLDVTLAEYEQGTGNQVIVATVASLDGDSVENYANLLFRHWALGQKNKSNGALLLVAPQEHKARIEVGYGLEGTLTDAVSSQIIYGVMLPQFQKQQLPAGVVDGAHAILDVLGGKGLPVQYAPKESPVSILFFILLIVIFMVFAGRHPVLAYMLLSNARFGSSSGYGGTGGSSSGWGGGGGGSSGGGGASGSW